MDGSNEVDGNSDGTCETTWDHERLDPLVLHDALITITFIKDEPVLTGLTDVMNDASS